MAPHRRQELPDNLAAAVEVCSSEEIRGPSLRQTLGRTLEKPVLDAIGWDLWTFTCWLNSRVFHSIHSKLDFSDFVGGYRTQVSVSFKLVSLFVCLFDYFPCVTGWNARAVLPHMSICVGLCIFQQQSAYGFFPEGSRVGTAHDPGTESLGPLPPMPSNAHSQEAHAG